MIRKTIIYKFLTFVLILSILTSMVVVSDARIREPIGSIPEADTTTKLNGNITPAYIIGNSKVAYNKDLGNFAPDVVKDEVSGDISLKEASTITTELTSEIIERLQSYEYDAYGGALEIGFEEVVEGYGDIHNSIYETFFNEICTFGENEFFYTNTKLTYFSSRSNSIIRGVFQEVLTNGDVIECDMEFAFKYSQPMAESGITPPHYSLVYDKQLSGKVLIKNTGKDYLSIIEKVWENSTGVNNLYRLLFAEELHGRIAGDYFYFVRMDSDNKRKLMRISTVDDPNPEIVAVLPKDLSYEGNGNVAWGISDNWFYYTKEKGKSGKLARINIDTKQYEILIDKYQMVASDILVTDKKVYIIDVHGKSFSPNSWDIDLISTYAILQYDTVTKKTDVLFKEKLEAEAKSYLEERNMQSLLNYISPSLFGPGIFKEEYISVSQIFKVLKYQGEWVYFTHLDKYTNNKLYKVKLDGSSLTKINDDFNIANIKIIGEWIYYQTLAGNTGYNLYKVKTDGSSRAKLTDDDTSQFEVVGEWIYYQASTGQIGENLYKIKTEGSSIKKLDSYVYGEFVVDGEWIYYNTYDGRSGYNVYKIKTDGSGKSKVNEGAYEIVSVAGEWIYHNKYINSGTGYSLYRVKTDGSSQTKVMDASDNNMNLVGEWIYYSNSSDNYKLCKIKTDGSSKIKLNVDSSYTVNIVGDWIYYLNGSDSNKLYKIKTDGTGQTKLGNIRCYEYYCHGEWIYYNGYRGTYKVKTDGSEHQLVE